jgi:hypothetical protein
MNPNIEPSYKFDLIRDSFVSIYKAMKFLESSTIKNDLSIVDQRVNYLDLLDRCELYKFNEELCGAKIPEEISKIFEHFDKYDHFIKTYFDFMLRRDKYVAEEYGYLSKSILKRCDGCNEMNECVEIFISRILRIFTPDLINKNRKIEDLFGKYRTDIISFIETSFCNNAGLYGWRDNIRKDRAVSAYLTAEMLEYIFSWNETDCNLKLELRQGLNYNESLYKKCIESIRDLQINNIEKTKNILYSADIGNQNIYISKFLKKKEGGWFGKYIHDTWYIKVRESASIACNLNKIDRKNPICREVI